VYSALLMLGWRLMLLLLLEYFGTPSASAPARLSGDDSDRHVFTLASSRVPVSEAFAGLCSKHAKSVFQIPLAEVVLRWSQCAGRACLCSIAGFLYLGRR